MCCRPERRPRPRPLCAPHPRQLCHAPRPAPCRGEEDESAAGRGARHGGRQAGHLQQDLHLQRQVSGAAVDIYSMYNTWSPSYGMRPVLPARPSFSRYQETPVAEPGPEQLDTAVEELSVSFSEVSRDSSEGSQRIQSEQKKPYY